MLKHRPTDRSHTYIPPDAFSNWTHQTAQQGTESNGYRGTGPGERVRSVNERSVPPPCGVRTTAAAALQRTVMTCCYHPEYVAQVQVLSERADRDWLDG